MGVTRDVAAASKIGKLLGERLLMKDITSVAIHMKKEQRYHGKVKAVIANVCLVFLLNEEGSNCCFKT